MKRILLLLTMLSANLWATEYSYYDSLKINAKSIPEYSSSYPYYSLVDRYSSKVGGIKIPDPLKKLYDSTFDNCAPQSYRQLGGYESTSYNDFESNSTTLQTVNLNDMTPIPEFVIFEKTNLHIYDIGLCIDQTTVNNEQSIVFAGMMQDSLKMKKDSSLYHFSKYPVVEDSSIYTKSYSPVLLYSYRGENKYKIAPIAVSDTTMFKVVRTVVGDASGNVYLSGFHGVVQISNFYNLSWEHYFNENMLIYSNSVDEDNNVVIAGYCNDNVNSSKNKSTIISSVPKNEGFDIFSIALDKNGDIISSEQVSAVRWNRADGNKVLKINREESGLYSILGSFTNDSITIGDRTLYKQGEESGYFARLNSEGKVTMLYQANGVMWDYIGENPSLFDYSHRSDGGWDKIYTNKHKLEFIASTGNDFTLNGDTLIYPGQANSNSLVSFSLSTLEPTQSVAEKSVVPITTKLNSVYPNPFNPTTTISFSLPKTENVNVSVYNIKGQKVTTLFDNTAKAGNTSMEFNASRYASGVYFVRMVTAGGNVQSKKMVLIK